MFFDREMFGYIKYFPYLCTKKTDKYGTDSDKQDDC